MPAVVETRRATDLTARELYDLLRLRVDVFVVEQNCPYHELDGRDLAPDTVQLWAEVDGRCAATIRVLGVDDTTPAIGRVATAGFARGRGLAAQLITHGIALCRPDATIELHAQTHLAGWYARFGFASTGAEYLEDGIPHITMRRPPSPAP